MTYKETLDLARENHIETLKLNIAFEVECCITKEKYTFDTICSIVERVYLKSDCLSINEIALCLNDLLDKYSENDIVAMETRQIITLALDYHN